MHRTPFAGLTELDDGDPLLIDGGSFTQTNPSKIDRLLQVGAVSHRHDAHVALSDPLRAPSASLDPTGGSIPAETAIYVGYTVEDGQGGETRLSPVVNGTTDLPLNAPSGGIVASGDYSAGSLMIGNYYYGITFLDGAGGETPLGPTAAFARNPGAASAQVHLSGLATELNPPLGPVAWRLWRSQNGQQFQLLASGTSDTFLDNGVQCTDCTVQPPSPAPGGNTTKQTSLLHVTLPTPAQEPVVGSGTSHGGLIRLYLSTDGLFGSPSFYNAYPLSSAGADIQIPFLSVDTGSPPDVSTCVPGANQINPDTDMFDWHWKRPVANIGNLPSGSQGDVRLVIGIGVQYGVLGASAFGPGDWTPIPASGAQGAPGASATLAVGGPGVLNPTLYQRIALGFMGSGGTGVAVTDLGGGSAQVTISGPAPSPVPIVQPTVAGSAGVPKLLNRPYVEYAGSGGQGVAIQDMGGGSARVLMGPPGQQNVLLSPEPSTSSGPTGSGTSVDWNRGSPASAAEWAFGGDPANPASANMNRNTRVWVPSGTASITEAIYDPDGAIGHEQAAITLTHSPTLSPAQRASGNAVTKAAIRVALEYGSGQASRVIQDSLGFSDFKPKEIIGSQPLPSNPYHGQEIYYLPDPVNQAGVRWHCVYNAWSTSQYKWEVVGGSPLVATLGDEVLSATTGSWIDATTVGPLIVVPIGGDYDCRAWSEWRRAGGATTGFVGIAKGANNPVWQTGVSTPAAVNKCPASTEGIVTGVVAGTDIRMRYFQDVGGASSNVNEKRLFVMPVRIG